MYIFSGVPFDNLGLILGSGGIGTVLTAAVGLVIRRYRRSAGRELQPFLSYVWSSIALAVKRRLRPALARRFGVRPFAELTLEEFSRRLPIPSRGRGYIDIERAYIRLSLSASPDRRIDDEALATHTGSILIFGEPGSGKSSLTKKLYREELKRAYLKPFRSRLPLHLELGKLPWTEMPEGRRQSLEWMRGLLTGLVRRVKRVNEPDFVFSAFAEGPGLVLFLDGLDEVAPHRLKTAETLIGDLISSVRHSSTKTTVIVTARTQLRGLLSRDFVDGFTEVLVVTPFTPADVFAFLRRWEYPPERRLHETHRVFEHLRRNATLFAMCTNPLVLAMYVAEDERLTGDAGSSVRLADTRVRFYDQVVGELLYFRREDQQPEAEPLGSSLLTTREDLLGRIALDHLLESGDPANLISLDRAARIAQRHWKSASVEVARQQLRKLAVDTGMVTVQQEGRSLQFIHLSICEYLAGKELTERNEQQLDDVLRRIAGGGPAARRLWETAIFAVALSKRDPRVRAFRCLAGHRAPNDLILRVFREVQLYDLPEFAAAVQAATTEIFAHYVDEWNAAWIDRVRLLLSCLADAHRLAAVRRLEGIPSVPDWFDSFVGDDPGLFAKVFDLYLAVSPAEALRLAGELGVREMLFADPEPIVQAMEHPDMIALAMKMVMDGAPDAGLWIDALAEAALRIELVAQTLVEEQIPPRLRTQADQVDEKHAWHRFGPARETFYGAVLAVAASRVSPVPPGGDPVAVGRVELVSHVRPRWRKRLARRNQLAAVASAVGGGALLLLGWEEALLLAFLILSCAGVFFFLRASGRVVTGEGRIWPTATRAQMLGLQRPVRPAHDLPNMCLVSFNPGRVRLYAGRDHLEPARRVDIATVSWLLPVWNLVAIRSDGRFATGRHPGQPVSLMNRSALGQAVNVLRMPGPLVCIPLQPKRSVVFLPPREARAEPSPEEGAFGTEAEPA